MGKGKKKGEVTKWGHKGVREHVPYFVYMLIKDFFKVINKQCVQGARYMCLISWIL